ncbi:MFS transporter [Desulfatitalea alkaliphila]|uniref:MFS transporter n=1 Tax=Desulfatitalea alkaliphila TaxID=2929485 RepID=A0AA41UL34_9BACT|nr:MFS transporter [Desulfatitalea alkaliphila]MCJ8502062.1 MFS transporter [Desulfatitalea alkaliphila]
MADVTSEYRQTRQDRRAVWGWAMYDWANSAFATTVMAAFFPVFFKQEWSRGVDANLSTARLGMGVAAAGLLVALLAPYLGAVSDQSGRRKTFLMVFTVLGVAMTASLALIPQGQWLTALLAYALATIGFAGGLIFYDALLPQVAPLDRIDQVSSLGYALGYLGGGALLVLNVAMTLQPAVFGLADAGQAVRFSFASVAIWWGLFSLVTFAWLPPEPRIRRRSMGIQVVAGWRQLMETFRKVRRLKTAFLFLVAYFCYIDGVGTIIRMAVDFGMSLGFDFKDLIVALIITQFIGFPAALVFGQLGKHWGVRRSIFLALAIYMGVTIYGATMNRVTEFYVLAAVIGLVQGGIQALSRSYFARFIPLGQNAEFYGFYNMIGKFAAIMGPALMGATGLLVRHLLMPATPTVEQMHNVGFTATRWSIVAVLLLFGIGAVLLRLVDEEKGRAEAAAFH